MGSNSKQRAPDLSVAELPSGAVRTELDHILASQSFSRTERPGRFLRFLVEHALNGTADKLNEYVLAVEIFNRKPSFDPATDPIVRVEAGRLRRKLQEYYRSEGSQDPVVIDLPQRTYVPVFRKRQPPPVPVVTPPKRSWLQHPALSKVAAVLVLSVVVGSVAYWATSALRRKSASGAARNSPPSSIVVLPFNDLSPNHDQEYFCDGLTEELTESLTRIQGLRVIARTTAFHFKRNTDVRDIGKQLGVALVLEGSVRKSGERVRISSQLVNTVDGYHVWSQSYDRQVKDIIAVQEEIARSIAAKISTGLTGRERRPLVQSPPDAEAYDLYLKALYTARQWSTEALTQSVELLRRATAVDSTFAPAYSALSEYYALLGAHAGLRPNEVMPKAKAAALRAIELDDSLAHAHASLGLVQAIYEWDWPGADQSFRRARELDPNDAEDRQMYVMGYLVPQGRLDDALREIQEARSRDPISPRVESILGMVYYFRRDYDRAIEQFRKPLQLDSHFEAAHLAMGSAYEQKARFAEAVASLQEGSAAWRSGVGASMLGHTYALMGKEDEARKLIQELVTLSKTRYVSPAYIAAIYAGLRDNDRTMEWLEKAYDVHSASLVFLKVNPRFDAVRSDPRFAALLRRVRLN